jgi:hypothetical protein
LIGVPVAGGEVELQAIGLRHAAGSRSLADEALPLTQLADVPPDDEEATDRFDVQHADPAAAANVHLVVEELGQERRSVLIARRSSIAS